MGYPLVELARLPSGAGRVTPRQRRFFADPEARGSGAPARWLVPVVLRFRDATGTRLLPAPDERRSAERLGLVSDQWALVRAGEVEVGRSSTWWRGWAPRPTTSCSRRSSRVCR